MITLVFSPDDYEKHGKGWYWERSEDWKRSQLFESNKEAAKAKKDNKIKWED